MTLFSVTKSQIDSYNASNKTIIYWISDDGTSTNQFEVYNGGNLNGTIFNAITDIELGATAVIFGTIKKYGSVYEFQAGNYLISYTTPIRSIEFTFTPNTFIKSGEEGAFTYECEVDNVTATYVSSNPSVLEIIDATTGAYRAKAAGSALITLTLSKGGDSGSKTVGVNVASISSVSEAYTVASSLSNNETTSEYYYVKGYVIDLDADGYSRSIDVTDGINVIRLFFGASNIDYENIVNSDTNIGSKITVFGRIQNYSGLYELKDLVVDDVESADADSFSAAAYVILNEECEIGPSAVSSGTWSMLAEAYNCLSSTEKEKLTAADVTPYGSNVVKWVNRYTIICNNSSLSNFMTRSDISSRFISDDSSIETSNTMIIYAVIGLSSLLAISSLILIKRKKHR